MTDTTDQQAVTVAQEDREAATLYWQSQDIGSPETYAQIRAGRRDDSHLIRAFARHRRASVSSASVETLALQAIKAVTATAKDGAAGLSRIMAITNAAGVQASYSELLQDPAVALIVDRPRTEWAHLFKPDATGCAIPPDGWQCSRARGHTGPCAASPEPVPATNQAGEVDMGIPISHQAGEVEAAGRNLYLLQGDNSRMADALRKCRDQFAFYAREHYAAGKSDKGDTNTRFADIATKALEAVKPAALATQPATSQEGEAYSRGAEAMREAVIAWLGTHSTAFKGYWHCDPQDALDAMATLPYIALAATPTPPTLSEDLREAVEQALQCTPSVGGTFHTGYHVQYDCGDPWEILRSALAQVKAS